MAPDQRRRTWGTPSPWLLAAAALVLATVVVATGWGSDRATIAVADLSSLGGSVLATGLLVRLSRESGPHRSAWTWLAVGAGLWSVGEVIWTWVEVVEGEEVPFPSVADIAYLGATPFIVVGVLGFSRGRGTWFRLRDVVDSLVVAASALFVIWALVLGPAWRTDSGDPLTNVVSVTYPLVDLVLVVLALVVVRRGEGAERAALTWVAASLLVMAIVDSAFTWMLNQGTFSTSHPVVMLWPAAYLLLAFATTRANEAPRAPGGPVPVAAVLAPHLPLLAAALVAAPRVIHGEPLGVFLTTVGGVVVGLVLVRQILTTWDLRTTVAALHARERELERLAHADPLTGLANRARLSQRLEQLVRHGATAPAVVFIDLDGFKAVNDRFGHATGDQLLVEVSGRLLGCMDEHMLLARLGGDEFLVLAERGHDAALAVARDILVALSLPFHHQGARIPFQASLGIATAPAGGSPEEAVRRADAAMYAAKASGKGRAVDYPDVPLELGVVTEQ